MNLIPKWLRSLWKKRDDPNVWVLDGPDFGGVERAAIILLESRRWKVQKPLHITWRGYRVVMRKRTAEELAEDEAKQREMDARIAKWEVWFQEPYMPKIPRGNMSIEQQAYIDDLSERVAELKAALEDCRTVGRELDAEVERLRALASYQVAVGWRDKYLRLQSIVDQLSTTRDGVPITPNLSLYYVHPKSKKVYLWMGCGMRKGTPTSHYDAAGRLVWIGPSDCYSSREAAEAAGGTDEP